MSYNTTEQALTHTVVSLAATADAVAGVASKAVYVYSGFLVAAGTVTLTIKDSSGGSALTGAMTMTAGVPFPLPANADGKPLFTTTAGNGLNFTLGGSVQVSGWLKTVQA